MSNSARILCVDDERNVLRALERIFLDDDYEILTASSGEEGLQQLNEAGLVQVVISDFRMPGMNGVEFLKEVFKLRPETIRIVLSGYADTAAVVAAINEGKIYKFIPKPWNDDELRLTVAKALETFAVHRRNEQLAEELRRKNQELSQLNANLEQHASRCGFMPGDRCAARGALILEQLPVAVITLDADAVVLQINREASLMLQVNREEMLGKRLSEAFPAARAALEGGLLSGAEGCRLDAPDGRALQIQATPLLQQGEEGFILTLSKAD